MILEYLKERFGEEQFLPLSVEEAAAKLHKGWAQKKVSVHQSEHGFISYTLKGDAVIIHDLYIKPESRGHVNAFKLHDKVIAEAREAGKRVAIGFTEVAGKNHILGIKAMKIAGFQPAQKTDTRFVFIKGI